MLAARATGQDALSRLMCEKEVRKRTLLAIFIAFCCPAGVASRAFADIVCPDSSYVTVSFSKTYSGSYRTGQPYDYVTISPQGNGETFASTGIAIRVYLRNCQNMPIAGVPKEQILLVNSSLCLCPGGNVADHDTDANGVTEFSGTIRGGRCANSLTVSADGISLGAIPVKINSADGGSSPCFVDSSDLAAFAQKLGQMNNYNICFDYNESGSPIDASDLAFFATLFRGACR